MERFANCNNSLGRLFAIHPECKEQVIHRKTVKNINEHSLIIKRKCVQAPCQRAWLTC